MDNVVKIIDGVQFYLKRDYDFNWIQNYGKLFIVFDQQDSGNICFGLKRENKKFFTKYAGAPTINYNGNLDDAILRMKNAIPLYRELKHPNLIKLVEDFELDDGYACVYEWADGDCLHAHWNFDKYPKYTHPQSPNYKFRHLSLDKKLICLGAVFDFHQLVAEKGYIAVDFYDGSIMYDFNTNKTTICDIDFYQKSPFVNNMGQLWGSTRFMSPEEYELGAKIDETSNVVTMGATAFELLGNNFERSIKEWSATEDLFMVAKKATNPDRSKRYKTIKEFYTAWKDASN